eukprot:1665635-Prymnesium_polylepis.3
MRQTACHTPCRLQCRRTRERGASGRAARHRWSQARLRLTDGRGGGRPSQGRSRAAGSRWTAHNEVWSHHGGTGRARFDEGAAP